MSPTVMFFWDYDTQWGADQSRSPGGPKEWGHLEFANTEQLLPMHADFDIPACFAVVGSAALDGARPYHDPRQIRQIAELGHEIASHSHQHNWLPGLNRQELLKTLRDSKDALEQCVGEQVTSFVPPFNQPFDYPPGMSISLSERREAGRDRTGLRQLCESLGETGYEFCRVAYRPAHLRIAQLLLKRRVDSPGRVHRIAGITCVRTNAGGFGNNAHRLLEQCAQQGGLLVIYGHPHSLSDESSPQSFDKLRALLQAVAALQSRGVVRCVLPREITEPCQLPA